MPVGPEMRTLRCSRTQRPSARAEDDLPVEAAAVSEVDVLDAGLMLEPGAAQPVGELSRVPLGELAVDEQAEPFFEREGLDLGGIELLGEGLGHPGAAKLQELVHGRMSQHRSPFRRHW